MPRRLGSRKAVVGFLHADPRTLSWASNTEILSKLSTLKEAEFGHMFDECTALFEDNGEAPDRGNEPREHDFRVPIRARRVRKELNETYTHKLDSEKGLDRKIPGTPSTRAAIYLTPNTYVLVAGSINFCQRFASLCFSELGANKLSEIFLGISSLKEWRSSRNLGTDTLFQYDTEDNLFDACNFDALAEKLKLVRKRVSAVDIDILSPSEVQERLYGKGCMSASD